MYTYVLELRFVLAAYCKSIPCFLKIIFYFYMILYDICILLHHIYKRIILEQHEWDTFITLTILGQSNLPGDIHYPDVGSQLNLPRFSEFCNCFNGIKPFSLDILTRSNTLKLFPFLMFLSEVFLHSY